MRSIAPVFVALIAFAAVSEVGAAPRSAGARPASGSVEAGMWAEMDKAETHLRQTAELNRDEALNSYIRSVTCKVSGDYCPEIRIYILDRPFFNATMGPNGYAEIWSGLLLRCQNEAQLAFVLSHEVGHYSEEHSIEAFNADKLRANATLALSVGVAFVGAYAALNAPTYEYAQQVMNVTGNTIDLLYLSRISALFAYSRRNEFEADQIGISLMGRSGYDQSEAVNVWRALELEAEASDFEKVRRIGAIQSIFSTHPINSDRIEALEARLRGQAASGLVEAARYREAIRPFVGKWLRQELRRKDFGQTLFLLDRLSADTESMGTIEFFRGEVYRLRRNAGDLELAQAAYERATFHSDAPVETWRELGDILKRRSSLDKARAAYVEYRKRAPSAEDGWIVDDEIKSLTKEGEK